MPLNPARPGRRLRATIVAAVGLALAVGLLTACASTRSRSAPTSEAPVAPAATSPAAAAAPVATAVTAKHVFAAYRPGGAPTAGVTAHRSGSCFTTSITVAATHAYRCFTGHALLDPCFATSAGAATVACYADPWHGATLLSLTAPLPAAAGGPSITRPWAIELAGGRRCTVATGVTTVVHGVALGYRCGPDSAGLSDTSGSLWRALYRSAAGTLRTEAVLGAWSA